ncbi:MAG: AI-2E family transporter [Balneolaceae bacterium]
MLYKEKWYVTYTVVLIAIMLTVYSMILAKSVLLPLLFAIFFAILLSPLCNWLERYRIPRVLSALFVILGVGLILVGIGFLFYTQILEFVEDLDLIEQRFRELLDETETLLSTWFGMEMLIEFNSLEDRLIALFRDNVDSLRRGLASAASVLTAVFLVPIYLFLMLIFRNFLQEFLLQAFGRGGDEQLERATRIFQNITEVIQQYITGVIIVIMILAVIDTFMLWMVGVNHYLFFGIFAAMLNVIPFLGPIFGSIFPTVYALLTMDSLLYPFIIVISFYVIQLFEGNLFTPVIVGSKVSMNALMTLFLLFVGAQIWGLAGMILFIPMGAMLKVIFDEFDSLRPYGFLLGRVPSGMHSRKGPLARRISELGQQAAASSESQSG